jgi:hypothetical protein
MTGPTNTSGTDVLKVKYYLAIGSDRVFGGIVDCKTQKPCEIFSDDTERLLIRLRVPKDPLEGVWLSLFCSVDECSFLTGSSQQNFVLSRNPDTFKIYRGKPSLGADRLDRTEIGSISLALEN